MERDRVHNAVNRQSPAGRRAPLHGRLLALLVRPQAHNRSQSKAGTGRPVPHLIVSNYAGNAAKGQVRRVRLAAGCALSYAGSKVESKGRRSGLSKAFRKTGGNELSFFLSFGLRRVSRF